MAKKKVAAIVKIQIPAGKATPAPPVGTALGPHGVAIMDFCKAYNAAPRARAAPSSRSRSRSSRTARSRFILKTPPTPVLAAPGGRARQGQPAPGQGHRRLASPMAQVEEIAKIKMPDLNANDIEAAKLQVAGTARSMGITVVG